MTIFRSTVSCRLWLTGLFLLMAGGWLRADIEAPKKIVRVPIAQPAQAVAVRGFPVEIKLNGTTASTQVLQFILRKKPKQGRLEGPVAQAGKDSVIFRYTPDAASTAEVDTFSFAVKVDGSGSSDEAPVTIRLVDPAPVLEMPGGMDLGRVLLTEVVEKTIPIHNKGNASFIAAVPLPEGWSWIHPAGGQFNLEPGGRIDAVVRVRVKKAGEIDQKLALRPEAVVRFIGRAIEPFLGYPSLLRLQWERGTARRAYRFSVRNNCGQVITVKLSAPPGVDLPAEVAVPVAESKDVSVTCTGDLSRAVSGRIRLEALGWIQDIEFEAPAAPPSVEIDGAAPDGRVDFGILEKAEGQKAIRRLTLRNVGGGQATVRWDPLRFFILEGMEPEMVLAPQAKREFTLRPSPDEPGRLKEELTLRMTGGDKVLPLFADIDPNAVKQELMSGSVLKVVPPTTSGAVTAPVSEEARKLRIQIFAPGGGLMENTKKDATLPRVDVVRLIEAETTPDRLVFEWNAPAPGTWTYKVMVRALRFHRKGEPPVPEYGEMDNVKVSSTPAGGRAEVTKLRPEARWSCRILAIRSDGVSNKEGQELVFYTAPLQPSRWPWWLAGGFGIVSLALYIRQKWREDVKWKD